MLEGPLFHGTIGRLAESTRNLRAWGLTMQMSLLIESPVIMLLATSIALGRDREAYRTLRAFTMALCIFCTTVAAVISLTPLLDLLGARVLGYPQETVDAARMPLRIMILWSAFIGWRRFRQGLMVRNGQTRRVTAGTLLRLGSMAIACTCLVSTGTLSGATAAAMAMMVGVALEAGAATLGSRPLVRELPEHRYGTASMGWPEVSRFHAPLAATALISLASGPVVAAGLAALPDKYASLAAWPVVFSLLLVLRGWGLAVQETTVGQLRSESGISRGDLYRFATGVGIATVLATILLATGPILASVAGVLSLPDGLVPLVRRGLLLASPLPLLTTFLSWARGTLTADSRTVAVYQGTALALAVQGGFLWLAGPLGLDPMAAASGSMLVSEVSALAHAGLALRNGPRTDSRRRPVSN